MDVTINGTRINIPPGVASWGDLLDWIETDYLRAGQCITHVYLGGTETFNYRDRLVREQDLEPLGSVEIISGDFDKVVHESLAELDQELYRAAEACGEIVRLFENRQEDEAYNRLVQLLESIRLFYTIFSEDLGWSEPTGAEISREEFSAVLERALTELITAQERRHWVSICDVLEYAITPILQSWHTMVERTREHVS
jgi:hypothetical protein